MSFDTYVRFDQPPQTVLRGVAVACDDKCGSSCDASHSIFSPIDDDENDSYAQGRMNARVHLNEGPSIAHTL